MDLLTNVLFPKVLDIRINVKWKQLSRFIINKIIFLSLYMLDLSCSTDGSQGEITEIITQKCSSDFCQRISICDCITVRVDHILEVCEFPE